MALLLMPPDFPDNIEQEAHLCALVKGLPEDWDVVVSGRRATGVYIMTIRGKGIEVAWKLFAPAHVVEAIRWLERIKPAAWTTGEE
jgi:hypothetical protein